jgi:hypothetical protein
MEQSEIVAGDRDQSKPISPLHGRPAKTPFRTEAYLAYLPQKLTHSLTMMVLVVPEPTNASMAVHTSVSPVTHGAGAGLDKRHYGTRPRFQLRPERSGFFRHRRLDHAPWIDSQ